jgi:hypothetical protein
MRLLIAYEDSHRAYGTVMEEVIRDLRPHLEVRAVEMDELEAPPERFDPHAVISERRNPARRNPAQPGGRVAWIMLSYDPGEPSEVCLEGRYSELENPGLEKLLAIVDQAEESVREGRRLGGC